MSIFRGSSGHILRFWPPRTMTTLSSTPLSSLRDSFDSHDIGYYIILTQDEHDSEYVAPVDKRREFISGFTGSAGVAIIGKDFAELSTDGRYFLQAAKELSKDWTLRKEGTEGVDPWFKAIAQRARNSGLNIGVDPRLVDYSVVKKISDILKGSKAQIKPVTPNLVDEVWKDQPAQPDNVVFELPTSFAGETSSDKIEKVRAKLGAKNVEAILVSALDEIAWLFNLRGSDIAYNPVFKSFAIVSKSEARLYVDPAKIASITGKYPKVTFLPYQQVFEDAKAFGRSTGLDSTKSKEAGFDDASNVSKIWVPQGASWALVEAAGGSDYIVDELSPISVLKAAKNPEEIKGAKLAQVKCGLSIVTYLAWISRELKNGAKITEFEGSQKLLSIREHLEDFRGQSFETISSAGANAAIIHYAPSPDGKTLITDKEIYLLDSGCQFTHGTTDTTRTVHFGTPSTEEKLAFTLVLKGHISLATAVFPKGTSGFQLDLLARQHLWKFGLDYLHGTGHGVGSFLNVHEGPMSIGTRYGPAGQIPLEVGNLISNEPGYYQDGKYGIRIESLVLVKEVATPSNFAGRKYLGFHTITLAPLATNLIDVSLLDKSERDWVNDYNAGVREALDPHLSAEDREWLQEQTKDI